MARDIFRAMGAIFLALCFVFPTTATVYTVGDAKGWALNVNYEAWTSGKTFLVGDTLVFNYVGGEHIVNEVSASGYSSCNTTNSISTEASGTTKIPLKTAGKHYFICTKPSHCSLGMKLAVTVGKAAPATSGSPVTMTHFMAAPVMAP